MKKMKDYKYHIGIKLRGYPSRRQVVIMRKNGGCARFVYNRCIAVGREVHDLKKVTAYCEPVAVRLAFLRTEAADVTQIANLAPFLNDPEVDNQALHNAVANYRKAWGQFHKVPGTGIPTFHKKRAGCSYQTNAHYGRDGKVSGAYFPDATHVRLPKVGTVRVKGCKPYVEGTLANAERLGTFTVELTASGECYISASLASDTPFFPEMERRGSLWDFDANVENLLTGSDGEVVENPAYFRKSGARLAKQQRILARRYEAAKRRCPAGMKLSRYLGTCKNYQKQRRKVASIHEHIARQRKDYLNRVTKREVKNHDLIAGEDLKVKDLVRNHCLAKSISDVSWGEMFRQFRYKAEWYGKVFIQVPPHYTTQTCSACGYVLQGDERLTLDDRDWVCPACGVQHNRDENSANVILGKAVRILLSAT